MTNLICLQEVSVGWANLITVGVDEDGWRTHVNNQLFMAWRVDSLERIEIDWKLLFLKEESVHKNWRGYSKVRLGFLGWSTAASPVRKRQSSGTGPARKAAVDSFSHRVPPNFD